MFQLLADEANSRRIGLHLRKWGLGMGAQLTVILAISCQQWLSSVPAGTPANSPPEPPRETFTLLAPPPGRALPRTVLSFSRSPSENSSPGAPVKIDEGTSIAFDADEGRQLLPVLRAFNGLIVFVPLLDRLHPLAAFRPDGSPAPLPGPLDHWIRIRLANPSWWPEVEALSSVANAGGDLEAVAVLPPAYRARLGAAVQMRMNELRSGGRITGVSLHLDASHPAGVIVQTVRLATGRTG